MAVTSITVDEQKPTLWKRLLFSVAKDASKTNVVSSGDIVKYQWWQILMETRKAKVAAYNA